MGALAVAGRRRTAGRMLAAVGLVYLGSEVLGQLWPRERPFARLSEIEALVPHTPQRSFPSRHVASGLAMAAVGQRAHPLPGAMMAAVAWLLGLSRSRRHCTNQLDWESFGLACPVRRRLAQGFDRYDGGGALRSCGTGIPGCGPDNSPLA